MPRGRPQQRAVKEIGRQLALGQFDADGRGARPIGETGRLDPAQSVAQNPAQCPDLKAKRRPLRRQFKAQFLAVIGHAVFQPRDLGKAGKLGLQADRCFFQCLGIGTENLHIDGITTGAAAEPTEADGFSQRKLAHLIL